MKSVIPRLHTAKRLKCGRLKDVSSPGSFREGPLYFVLNYRSEMTVSTHPAEVLSGHTLTNFHRPGGFGNTLSLKTCLNRLNIKAGVKKGAK